MTITRINNIGIWLIVSGVVLTIAGQIGTSLKSSWQTKDNSVNIRAFGVIIAVIGFFVLASQQ